MYIYIYLYHYIYMNIYVYVYVCLCWDEERSNFWYTFENKSITSSRLLMSADIGSASGDAESSAVSFNNEERLPTSATDHPSSNNARALALPIPLPAPVTIAILLVILFIYPT